MFHGTWAIHLGAVMDQSSMKGQGEIEKKESERKSKVTR